MKGMAAAVSMLFLALALMLGAANAVDDRLIGWQGTTYTPADTLRGHHRPRAETARAQWVEVVAWEPRAFLYHNFLSPKECLYLIHKAAPHMIKSTVVDSSTGGSVPSKVRTSSGTFLRRGQDDVIKSIEKRIADFTFIPQEHGEGFQVLHYELGQKYESHFDYFHDEINTQNGGQRIATVLMYLSDVESGGETVFPDSNADPSKPDFGKYSECGKGGAAVRPRRGDALLFWSLKPDASLDDKALHAGCPVVKGSKWSATKWIRVKPYST